MTSNMLNDFGKWSHKFRIEKNLLLKDMAKDLKISSAFLSAIERGCKNIPDDIFVKICDIYQLDIEAQISLTDAITNSRRILNIDLINATTESRELAYMFVKKFHSITPDERVQILKILKNAIPF